MRKVLLAVVLIIVMSIVLLYRPVANQKMCSMNYATIGTVSFSYAKDRTANELLQAVKDMEKQETVKDSENTAVDKNMPNLPTGSNATIETMIAFAEAQLGKSYVYGATGPDHYDCSGLTQAAYAAAGITIGRNTTAQLGNGKAIDPTDKSQWKRGDLLFPHANHVVIYLGNDEVLHSPQTGDVVKIDPNYISWHTSWYGVRRYVE